MSCVCRFRLVCPEWRQYSISRLLEVGELTGPCDCVADGGVTESLTGWGVNVEGSAEDIYEQVQERVAIQGDD